LCSDWSSTVTIPSLYTVHFPLMQPNIHLVFPNNHIIILTLMGKVPPKMSFKDQGKNSIQSKRKSIWKVIEVEENIEFTHCKNLWYSFANFHSHFLLFLWCWWIEPRPHQWWCKCSTGRFPCKWLTMVRFSMNFSFSTIWAKYNWWSSDYLPLLPANSQLFYQMLLGHKWLLARGFAQTKIGKTLI
jgi:hypothetical protein